MFASYLFSFLLTIAIEQGVFALFWRRGVYAFYAVAVANALTHPILHIFLYSLIAVRAPIFYPLLASEIAIIVVEAFVLSRLFSKPIQSFILPSAFMNLISFGIGELVF